MKKKILVIIIVATLCFIWVQSMLPRDVSTSESVIVSVASGIDEGVLRKIAHAAEFAALGLETALFYGWFKSGKIYSHKNSGHIMTVGFLVALLDETIQIFSGRAPQIVDVWIDVGGFAIGAVITMIVFATKYRKNKDKEKQLQ